MLADLEYSEIEKSVEFTQSFDAVRYFTGNILEFKEAFKTTQKIRLHDSFSCTNGQEVIDFFGKWPQYRAVDGLKLVK